MTTILHVIALALATLLPDAGLAPAEVDLGAAMVCAEARGASPKDRRAVAGVLRNRVQASGGTLASVALAPRQFAKPCPRRAVLPEHRADFLAGWLGLGMPEWWSAEVVAFQTHRSARACGRRWAKKYRWRRVDRGKLEHTFWEGKLRPTAKQRCRACRLRLARSGGSAAPAQAWTQRPGFRSRYTVTAVRFGRAPVRRPSGFRAEMARADSTSRRSQSRPTLG